jgi:glutaredoxin-like YruB-family protein
MRRGTCASACAAAAAALLALALAGCDRGASAPPQPPVPAAQPAPPPAPAPPRPVDTGDIDPGPGERVFWQVADADGVRFYDDIERVPEALRAKARAISLGPASESAAAAPAPAAAPIHSAPPAGAAVSEAPAVPAARDPDGEGRPAREAAVVVYTTAWCPWCRKTLAWLDEQGVAYVNKDIERNLTWRRELIEKTGQAAIPVVEIDDQIIRGFDPDRMDQLL